MEAKRKPPNAGKGRPRGSANKVTREFRETVQRLLEDNADNVALWLAQIAEGSPATYDKAGKLVFPARPPDPSAAAQRLAALAEFAAPKLTRAEVTGAAGGALTVVVHKVA
jgi:hypothetical protein